MEELERTQQRLREMQQQQQKQQGGVQQQSGAAFKGAGDDAFWERQLQVGEGWRVRCGWGGRWGEGRCRQGSGVAGADRGNRVSGDPEGQVGHSGSMQTRDGSWARCSKREVNLPGCVHVCAPTSQVKAEQVASLQAQLEAAAAAARALEAREHMAAQQAATRCCGASGPLGWAAAAHPSSSERSAQEAQHESLPLQPRFLSAHVPSLPLCRPALLRLHRVTTLELQVDSLTQELARRPGAQQHEELVQRAGEGTERVKGRGGGMGGYGAGKGTGRAGERAGEEPVASQGAAATRQCVARAG